MSQTIDVDIRYGKEYLVYVAGDLEREMHSFAEERYPSRLALVVVDEKVYGLHKRSIDRRFGSRFDRVERFLVPEGEKSKNIRLWNKIVDFALNNGAERLTPMFAIGGGVTGDLAGFAAASALRGIPLIHIPTTLLAMVDSSIGGKTGVNHAEGKNLVGAFYQPDAVFAEVNYLNTLAPEEWINGLSEVLKYGAIRTPEIIDTVGKLIREPGFSPSEEWVSVIRESALIKSDIVKKDTLEAGQRAFLNFGHTFGHALERVAGYGEISHGQAVYVGMLAALHASRSMGADVDGTRLEEFRSLYPIQLERLVPDRGLLLEAMKSDKKVHDGIIRLVLLKEWGKPYVHKCEEPALIREAWNHVYEMF